jgi:hypothetical protein
MDLHSSFAQKILHLSKSEPEIDIVQLDEMIYCVHIHDTKTSNTQSLVLIGYDFQLVIIPDIMYRGQLIPRISFTAGLFNHVVIAIANGKLVLTR